jgi:hypothetical protein
MSERQAGTFRKGFATNAELTVLRILSENHVNFRYQDVVYCWGEFDGQGRPVSYKPDFIVNDATYGSGIVEVEGEGTNSDDPKRDHRLLSVGFKWVEHVPNKDARNVMTYLKRHEA